MTKIMRQGMLAFVAATLICAAITTNSFASKTEKDAKSHCRNESGGIISLSEGKENSFVITEGGALWAIGDNMRGQLGTGNHETATEFQLVLEDTRMVSAGHEHTIAIDGNGRLLVWGSNEHFQLGIDSGDLAAPKPILENTMQAAAGGFHTLAVKEDGTLWAWGSNFAGALGIENTKTMSLPTKVMNSVKEAGAGWFYSAAIRDDGSLWTWGWNDKGRLGTGSTIDSHKPVKILDNVKAIAIGPSHGLALKEDGTLWAWGDNDYGQLGDGTTEHRDRPVLVMEGVVEFAAGYLSSAAITEDGNLYTWGTNKGLWMGEEGKTPSSRPILVKSEVHAVSLGRVGSLVATEDGRLYLNRLDQSQVMMIENGRPVIQEEALCVVAHNERVYHSKRTDEQALKYYLQPTEQIQSDRSEIIALAAEITAFANTDEEKLLAIHDWICANLYYNYDAYNKQAGLGDISALGVLSEEATVCSGYSNLTAALLRASGIPAKYISGYASPGGNVSLTTTEAARPGNTHAWNEAFVNGKWVILDTTWNSKNHYEDGKRTERPHSREYFDMNPAQIAQTHMINEYTEFMISGK